MMRAADNLEAILRRTGNLPDTMSSRTIQFHVYLYRPAAPEASLDETPITDSMEPVLTEAPANTGIILKEARWDTEIVD
jgi:hypothetical protein